MPGAEPVLKRRDPVENINENSQVPDPDLTRFFFFITRFGKAQYTSQGNHTNLKIHPDTDHELFRTLSFDRIRF